MDLKEEIIHDSEQSDNGSEFLRLDKNGLPLVPQPTSHKDDPLNWSSTLKLLVALQVSWIAFLGPMASAVPNPAFVPLSKAFHISVVQASYELTVFLVCGGVGPLFVVPLANAFGRRPVYLLGNLVAAVTNIAAGYCTSWTGIMVTRAFNGLGAGSAVAIGPATICNLYFQHQRGLYMGIYTVFLTNGPHLSPIMGGFVAQYLGWRDCFRIPGYIQLGTFAITLFTLPETLYPRKFNQSDMPYKESSYIDRLIFRRNHLAKRKLRARDFARPFEMLHYIAVAIPTIFYMVTFGYGSVLFAVTGAKLFAQFYHFDTARTGLLLGIPLLIGGVIGESCAGWVTDWICNRYARRHGGERLPEARLDAIWVGLLVPIGIIIEGVCLSHAKTVGWIGAALGMGISGFGLQISSTIVFAYVTDCYKPQSAEISTVLTAFRQVFACLISFYAIPLGDRIGYQYGWLTLALIDVLVLIPMILLRMYGQRLRSLPSQSPPTFHNDI